ncbi:hypothetical protein [Hyphomonas oceanitis]|uniref:Uncharacterized protein n=1 Tax=Hyphomonas oceanitis SCH89 TaxID=1280953 RepID=A0A059G718_9PROT|nr:hypothetical protein [Hyphomonas oceanitis]KDA02268.1 hypothetical protein HOC_10918 [Hyphomonas oceanitis SCH89]
MTNPSAFVTHGIAQAQRALASVAVITEAHLNPSTLKRTLAQRARAELARLEIIIRRLLTLMALGLVLPPVPVRASSGHHSGTERVETKASGRLTGLSPRLLGPDMDRDGLATAARSCGPVQAAPILARLAALQELLAAPEAHARRLARTLDRQRKAGDAAPMALPMHCTHRMPPELGAIATALPELLRTAFKSWESSG